MVGFVLTGEVNDIRPSQMQMIKLEGKYLGTVESGTHMLESSTDSSVHCVQADLETQQTGMPRKRKGTVFQLLI